MATPTKLIFGLRTPQPTQLVVTSEPKVETLPLLLTSRNSEEISVRCDRGTWTVDLAEGDHLVRIEGEFEGSLQFTVTPKAAIVVYQPESPSGEYVKAWWATQGTTGGLSGNDPKDPWPPPMLDASEWLTEALRVARGNIAITREGPSW
jgi:hypothetical protein